MFFCYAGPYVATKLPCLYPLISKIIVCSTGTKVPHEKRNMHKAMDSTIHRHTYFLRDMCKLLLFFESESIATVLYV